MFTCFNKWKNYRFISIIINNCGLVLHSLLFIEVQLIELTFLRPGKIVNPMENTSKSNKSKYLHLQFFSVNIYDCL